MDRNGIELWRQSNLQRAPKTKGRAFRILGAYMNYHSFNKYRSLLEHIQLLERVRTEYRKASGVEHSAECFGEVLAQAHSTTCSTAAQGGSIALTMM